VTTLRTPYFNGDLFLTDSSGNYSFRSNAFPQAAVNPVTGDIYVAFNDWGDNSGKDRGNIYFTQSTDGGRKWSKPVQVNDDHTNNDQWFPALAVTPDGSHVGLFWYDRRLDPADNLIDRFGAIGTVSGHTVTFGANFRITDVSFPPAYGQDPLINPNYMGDYDQAVADNDYFYTTWGDNRLADAFHANQPDVRLAKVPVGWAGTDSALAAPALMSAAAAVSAPGAPLASDAAWTGPAVDAVFTDLVRASQATSSVANGDTASSHTVGLAPPALPRTTDPAAPPPARESGTLTAALPWRDAHAPADDGGTDLLTLAHPWWDGEAAT
jgi:hypothetical protein